ncbi:MAG TPA: Uma2 family endonuclease [Polyangiaceae bacterium]|nr:Uma2 family endonuclease [Polyangiaceae bacterium]
MSGVLMGSKRVERRYLREPVRLHFPVEEEVPESKVHRLIVNRLLEIVERLLERSALVSCDQFMYWDPSDPGKRLAPDLAVRLGAPAVVLQSWKIWELGAPHLAVEVVSNTDASDRNVDDKLARYRHTGVLELARFDPSERELRFWDRIDGDLVERDPSDPEARRCDALGLYWCVIEDAALGPTLRLARFPDGRELVLTEAEAALARVAELEAELARRR